MRGVLASALLLALAAPAVADRASARRAAAEFAAGQKLFDKHDYVAAAARFEAAYAIDPDPVYLFNTATALRLAHQCPEARDYYRRFLAAVPDVPNRSAIEAQLAEVEACSPTPTPPPPPPTPVPVVVAPPPRAVTPPTDPHRSRRRAGWILMASGAVLGAAGVYFAVDAAGASRDREALCPVGCTWTTELAGRAEELDDRGQSRARLALGAFAVGGAALVGGLALYLTGRATTSERVVVAPSASGASVLARFAF